MSKRVLVAPLDWGLGHATRCIPMINELLKQQVSVIIATNGAAYNLLQKEFPSVVLQKLPAYDIRYRNGSMIWNMGIQLPKIIWTIWNEHWQLQKLIQEYKIDIVISDNRYGCFSRKAKCIFVTHQLHIRIPNLLLQSIIQFCNHFFIRRFDECWIPDVTGENSLAGELVHPTNLSNVKFIGILSRMKPLIREKRWDAIIVLSGPEPQRTYLEEVILEQVVQLFYRFLIVQGKPEGETKRLRDQEHVEIISFLNSEELNEAMAASGVVICRSGYSSIMDLAMLGKKAILIPTPGQTEQEYLAARFLEQGIFYCQNQQHLDLEEALAKVKNFKGLQQSYSQQKLSNVIHTLLTNPE